ncbi:hypothetical protein [Chitinophaga arvensicola]|uniref:O-antigen ligase like membrane protein n=1 Tax=Chitinophaga arvensicola TaxID=29529 RepID=A0A1I0S4D6_9BACT|nr:hypothetical protein [Chitinophaga arvensicola]SEW49655.1 hypothetical protein SAMN04488122_3521 [Chitinophaga arvensicola]
MDEIGYSSFQSSNIFVECFREGMPLIVTIILLCLYYQKRISVIDTLLYAFATEAYTMIMIGPTFTATFFIGIFFLVEQTHQLITGRQQIRREYLLLLLLPFLSQVTVFLITQLYKDPFAYPGGKLYAFYTKPLYFYIKTYLPFFAIGAKIVQDREQLSFAAFTETVKKIARISCVIAVIQMAAQFTFRSRELSEFLGLQGRYMVEEINGPMGIRVQAWFSEPKIFSAFLSLAIPLFVKDRQYKMAFVLLVMGLLTSSQTFWVNMMAAGVLFFIFPWPKSVRWKTLSSFGFIVGIFLMVAASKEYFLKHYMENRNDPLYKTLFERSAYRYDNEVWKKDNIIMGIPLQRDMELPVVDFLRDEPYLLVSGYGAGNSIFIPPSYFFGQMNYQNHLAGIGGQNLNMRWFFILAEFGGVSLLFFFLVLTKTNPETTPFQRNYLAFVVICFFFSQIDLLFVIVALLCAYDHGPLNESVYEQSA